jgi:hypothetical protein
MFTNPPKALEQHPYSHVAAPRQKLVHDIQESLDHEMKADQLQRLGKLDLAAREYEKSLHLQERCFGKHHQLVEDFRYRKLLVLQQGSTTTTTPAWKRSAHRPAADALLISFENTKKKEIICTKLGTLT